jgi:hypothetical protein
MRWTLTQEHNAAHDPLVRVHLKKKSKWITNLIVHYTYEARLEGYKKNIHQLWHQIFAETPVMNTNLFIGNGNSRDFKSDFQKINHL